MEFERQAFRFHQKLLIRPATKHILSFLTFIVFCNLTFEVINLSIMHYTFVDRNHILKSAIESQLQTTMHRERFRIEEEHRQFEKTMSEINDTLANKTNATAPSSFDYVSKINTVDFSKKPMIPLKYHKKRGWFLYDESLSPSQVSQYLMEGHLTGYYALKRKN